MNATRKDIERQFTRIVAAGWLAWFQTAAKKSGTTTAHLLAIGSRETNLRNIRGDYRNGRYNGFGVMQVDIGTDPAYAQRWTPNAVEPSIRRGAEIYVSKVNDTKSCVGRRVTVRSRAFTGKAVEPDDLRRIATAAYNCGRWAHYHFSRGQHVDSTTTGRDYSRDVYDRAIEFADLLERSGLETDVVKTEIALQGKYARDAHRQRFGMAGIASRIKLPSAASLEIDDELQHADYERDMLGGITEDEIEFTFDELPIDEPRKDHVLAMPKEVSVDAPRPTGFMAKLKVFIGTVVTFVGGGAGLQEMFDVELNEQTVAMLRYVIPTIVICGFVGLVIWFVAEKIVGFKTMRLQAEFAVDPARPDLHINPQ